MNTLIKELSTSGGGAPAKKSAPAAITPALIDRLANRANALPESQLMDILDDFPHDDTVHTAIIARPYLPEAVIVRLLSLVSPALFYSLVSRHPLPEKFRREVMKRRPGRPGWWSQALLNIGR